MQLSHYEKEILLMDARESIKAKLENRNPAYNNDAEELLQNCGVFVSLHIKSEYKLRGCIGRMISNDPLFKTVRIMAIEAAFKDPRFPPIALEELENINLEISVLSPMKLCKNPNDVEVGKHGLYLIHKGRSGVLLPQVPVEQKWSRQEYLDYICIKAGLPPLSYQAPGAELYTFTALVFGE